VGLWLLKVNKSFVVFSGLIIWSPLFKQNNIAFPLSMTRKQLYIDEISNGANGS
jgi:hypothetical protein